MTKSSAEFHLPLNATHATKQKVNQHPTVIARLDGDLLQIDRVINNSMPNLNMSPFPGY